jgi:hypothetical protein
MTPLEELIEIYGRRRADDVAGDPDYVRLCKAHDGDNVFHSDRHRIEDIKRSLERQTGIQNSRQKQVKYALKLFHRLVGSEDRKYEICRRLARLSYYLGWTIKQKEYFDDTCTLIATKLDYFFSFTQRNQTGAGNPINSYHRYLIQSLGLPDPKDSSQNELACLLDRLLRASRYQFRGFFFPAHVGDSRQVTQKIFKALDDSVVFIQLVQNEMFSNYYVGRPNYCFEEYRRAFDKNKKMIFVFADGQHPQDLIPEETVLFDLDSWYQVIRGVDCLYMPPTRIAEQSANIQVSLDKLKERLVEAVQSFRESLWEGVPSDFD